MSQNQKIKLSVQNAINLFLEILLKNFAPLNVRIVLMKKSLEKGVLYKNIQKKYGKLFQINVVAEKMQTKYIIKYMIFPYEKLIVIKEKRTIK